MATAKETPSETAAPSLADLLDRPRALWRFAQKYSTLCPHHGIDYFSALSRDEIPASFREVNFRARSVNDLPTCCQQALARYNWWKTLQGGEAAFQPAHRQTIVTALYKLKRESVFLRWEARQIRRRGARPSTSKKPAHLAAAKAKAIDTALFSFFKTFQAAGGTILFGRKYGYDIKTPLASFLNELWRELPRDCRLASAEALVSRAREVAEGRVSWGRSETERAEVARRTWDYKSQRLYPGGLRPMLRVTAPSGLNRKHRDRYSVGGHKIGQELSLPCNWDAKAVVPVSEFWRKRLRDGDVRIVGSRPKRRKKKEK